MKLRHFFDGIYTIQQCTTPTITFFFRKNMQNRTDIFRRAITFISQLCK